MVVHVQNAELELAHVVVGAQVVLGGLDLGYELIGQGLSCLVMFCECVEILFLICPVLHYLAGKLHKVMIYAGSCHGGVAALGHDAVKGMAELMKHGGELIMCYKARGIGSRFREVGNKAYERTLLNAVLYLKVTE